MPKKKTKSRKDRGGDDEEDALETESVNSLASENSESRTCPNSNLEDVSVIESLLDRIASNLDDLTGKRPETRVKALKYLLDTFRLHYLSLDESWNYYETFLSGIEYVLKNGRSLDRTLAIECLAVFCLQTDAHMVVDFLSRFLTTLDVGLRDANGPAEFRSACATALSVFRFLSGYCDFLSPKDLMKTLEDIFKGSGLKGDGKAPVLDPSVSLLHINALRSWGLLYTILGPNEADAIGKALLPLLIKLLQTTDVDMRIMAGETAALIYERIRSASDEHYKGPYYSSLVSLLNELATDSTKSRSKVDRKKQRHYFRDFLDSLSKSDIAETSITVGPEQLVLSSCTEHFHYELLCWVLKGGLPCHLRENILVRNLFDLGLPVSLPVNQSHHDRRTSKGQRQLELSFASKIRTQKLNLHRDRRSNAVLEEL